MARETAIRCVVASMLWFWLAPPGAGQTVDDYIAATEGTFSTGALIPSLERYRSIPKTALYRDFLPPRTDLSGDLPLPGNQGKHGSCTAWALGYAARSYYAQAHEGRSVRMASNIPSPSYIYHSIRQGDCDTGTYITDGLDLLKSGTLSLREMPYSDRECPLINGTLKAFASDFRIKGYRRVDLQKKEQVKAELAQGNPVIFAFHHVPREFKEASTSATFRWQGPPTVDESGHAMTAIGYDEQRQAFRIINSWGRDWGDRGYLWVDYDTFGRLAGEAYVIEPLTGPPSPPPQPDDLSFRCSSLQTRTDGNTTLVQGFVGYEADLAKLKKRFADETIILDVDLRPWPQCEALLTLSELPQTVERPRLTLSRADNVYRNGDKFPLTVSTPSLPSYLYVSYLQADGTVVHLEQPTDLVPSPRAAHEVITFGDASNGSATFTIGGPFGREMVVALASEAPLFQKPLPQAQDYREYLAALRTVLAHSAEAGRRISADLAFFETREE